MVRSIGIEEELLIVDPEDGRPLSLAGRVLRCAETSAAAEHNGGSHRIGEPGGRLGPELQQQQLETNTPPRTDLAVLEEDLRSWRDVAIAAARKTGVRAVAVGTAPMPVEPLVVHQPRYEQMAARFGLTAAEQLTCGCHVHISVNSDAEAVGILDRIRIWLPCLLAISANSPFWQGQDTRYASFRSQALIRWPSAGPTRVFGSAPAYRDLVSTMLASGVLLDEGMVYFDARISHRYPTVEIRIADVCLDARDAILVAALCRGLVDTAAQQWVADDPAPPVSTSMLRLATWQAGHDGVDGTLLDPLISRPRPAGEVLTDLLEHLRPALQTTGDESLVEERLQQVLTRGNGARRQRSVLKRTGRMVDVVADLARVTAGQHR